MEAMHTAKEIERILVLCLCDSINYALLNSNGIWNGNGVNPNDPFANCYGQYWFQYFKEADNQLPSREQIAKDKNRVGDLDLQAFLKLLKFRKALRYTVMSFYHPNADVGKEFGDQSHFALLLNTLINNYRNGIAAHEGADDIRSYSEQNGDSYAYRYQDAIVDMMRLAKFFPTTCDVNGQTYYAKLNAIYEEYKSKLVVQYYDVIKTIQAEGLGIDVGVFSKICYEIGVDIYTNNGMMYFATDNYAREVDRIRGRLSVMRTQQAILEQKIVPDNVHQPGTQPVKSNNKKLIVIGASIIGALLVVIVILLVLLLGRNDGSSSSMSAKNDQERQAIITEKNMTDVGIFDDRTEEKTEKKISETKQTEAKTEKKTSETKQTEAKTERNIEPVSEEAVEKADVIRIKGETKYNGLRLYVDQTYSDSIQVFYENESNTFQLGWVTTPIVTCKTDKDPYYTPLNEHGIKIYPGSKGSLQAVYFENLEGNIESITISNIVLLDNRGFPANDNSAGESITIPISYEVE